MACYHFTMKLDRKPDGMSIGAETHLDYISREGRFKDLDFNRALAEQKFSGNMLCPAKTQDKDAVQSLYRSIYGSLIDNGIGIEASDQASVETLQIGLALAKRMYGELLDVRGTTDFKARVLVAANEMDFPVHFADAAMQAQYVRMQEEKENGRRESTKGRTDGSSPKGVHLTRLESIGQQRPPKRRIRLHSLSQCGLDEKPRSFGMLLPRDHAAIVEQPGTNQHTVMRRDVSRAIRIKADATAQKILNQNAGGVLAASHADYINRKENFAAKGGCIYTAHHLPKWAHGSAKKFFKAADIYERVNGTRYREIEFALPNELNLPQQKEIIDQFIERHLADHYYAYAIHDKIGAMSNGEHNTHVHIMFSDRELDALEREQERTPQMFFHRANAKHPEKGGCPKAAKWNDKNRAQHLCQLREDFALIQNSVLEKYGVKERVDHRSLRAQYIDALKKGNKHLAALLDRMPEEHVGPTAAADKKNQKVVNLLSYRQYKLERSGILHAAHVIEAGLEDEQTKISCAAALDMANTATQGAETESSDTAGSSNAAKVVELKEQVEQKMREIAALQDIIIWQPQALQMAREKFMSRAERETCQKLSVLRHEHKELVELHTVLPQPLGVVNSGTVENYERILDNLEADIARAEKLTAELEPQAAAIEARLAAPEIDKQIQREASQILHDDLPQKQQLQHANTELSQLVTDLKRAVGQEITKDAQTLANDKNTQTRFTAQEISEYLRHSYAELSKEYKAQQYQADQLKKQVLTFERAQAMAKNVYLKGSLKVWREQKRQLDKDIAKVQKARSAYRQAAEKFAALPKPKWYQNSKDYKAQAAQVEQMQASVERMEKACNHRNAKLQADMEHYAELCASAAGKEKIAAITQGILRKNQPQAALYAETKGKASATYARLTEIKELQKAVMRQVALDHGKRITYGTQKQLQPQQLSHVVGGGAIDVARGIAQRHGGSGLSINLQERENRKDYAAMDKTDQEAEKEQTIRLL